MYMVFENYLCLNLNYVLIVLIQDQKLTKKIIYYKNQKANSVICKIYINSV